MPALPGIMAALPGIMSQKIFQVDAFTAEPYKGNPAGVCILERPKKDEWMQSVAREMNVAETAFLQRDAESADTFGLRWFTPTVEVALCGVNQRRPNESAL